MMMSPNGIDMGDVAGMHDGCGGVLLDQRRAFDAIAGLQRRPMPCRRVDESGGGEIDRTRTALRLRVGHGAALGDVLERRLAHLADHGAAQADDLGLLVGDGEAVARVVHGIEQPLDSVAIPVLEQFDRQIDRDGMLLADIAHVGGAMRRRAGERSVTARYGLAAAPFHFREQRLHRLRRTHRRAA